MRSTECRECRGKLGVALDCSSQQFGGGLEILRAGATGQRSRLQVQIVRSQILSRSYPLHCRWQADMQVSAHRLNDGGCEVFLEREEICELPVVMLRPQLVAILGAAQLRSDTDAFARAAHAAFEHGFHFEVSRNLANVDVPALVSE